MVCDEQCVFFGIQAILCSSGGFLRVPGSRPYIGRGSRFLGTEHREERHYLLILSTASEYTEDANKI